MLHATITPLARAAQQPSIVRAALAYTQLGLGVVPLYGKRPAIQWRALQHRRASPTELLSWHDNGCLQNVGIICGPTSGNLVVLDVDALAGYTAFVQTFPLLAQTYTVRTGSGIGHHLYWFVDHLPRTTRSRATRLGNLELLALGCQVVAPPSYHPRTRLCYRVDKALPVQRVADLDDVTAWIQASSATPLTQYLPDSTCWQRHSHQCTGKLNPLVVDAVAGRLAAQGFVQRGTWLNGRCIYPQHHLHGDAHPSFGYNCETGYGYCFVCGTILTKEICRALSIDLRTYGGLLHRI